MKKSFFVLLFVLLFNFLFVFASGDDKDFGYIEFKVNDIPDASVRNDNSLVSMVELYRLNQSEEKIIDSKMLLEFKDQNIEIKKGLYELKVFTEDKIFTKKINVTEADSKSIVKAMYVNTQQKDIEADIPWGVEPGKFFPLLLMIHDADLNDYDVYDIKIYDDNILVQDDSDDVLIDILDLNGNSCLLAGGFETIDDKLWYKIRTLDPDNFHIDSQGFLHLRIYFNQAGLCDPLDWDVEVFKKINVLRNDLSKISNWYCGDTHYHSSYTDTWWGISEYVGYGEVGGPIEMAIRSLDSIGLDWVIVTDHSNSFWDNSGFWDDFHDECGSYDECLIGEEVNSDLEVLGNIFTCESLPGNHILAYGITKGYVDNGCNGVRDLSDILTSINSQGGFAYIAHPESKDDAIFGWDSIITNFREYSLDSYRGLQIWNQDIRTKDNSLVALEAGIEKWKDVLLGRNGLSARKVYVSAGSDAHGDFQNFGKEYTCCYSPYTVGDAEFKGSIFDALEGGNCYMSNFGAFVFSVDNLHGDVAKFGDEINILEGGDAKLMANVFIQEYCNLSFYEGIIDEGIERVVYSEMLDDLYPYDINVTFSEMDLKIDTGKKYYRVDCVSEDGSKRIYTNPIWVSPIKCFVDADCGRSFMTSSCESGKFCEANVSYSCVDGGSRDARCEEKKVESCEECKFGCDDLNGVCVSGGLCVVNSPNSDDVFSKRNVPLNIIGIDKLKKIEYIDYLSSMPRWTQLCRNCDGYVRNKIFSDGEHDVLVRCSDSVDDEEHRINFFVDSLKPVILGVEPNRGFSDGSFSVSFREENPSEVFLNYNGVVEEVDDCVEVGTNWRCDVSPGVSDGSVKYWFVVEDVAGNVAESKKKNIVVDRIAPVVENSDSFWEEISRWFSSYINFNILITEDNFKEVVVNYDYRGQAREIRLCSRLKNGVCKSRFSVGNGFSNIKIVVRDGAGNSAEYAVDL